MSLDEATLDQFLCIVLLPYMAGILRAIHCLRSKAHMLSASPPSGNDTYTLHAVALTINVSTTDVVKCKLQQFASRGSSFTRQHTAAASICGIFENSI